MRANTGRVLWPGLTALLLALLLTCSAFSSTRSYASSMQTQTHTSVGHTSSVWTATTTDWAHVRTGPGTGYTTVDTYAPGTPVTVYDTVSGEVVWGDISNWYRISSLNSDALYIYGGLLAATSVGGNGGDTAALASQGKVIVVSIARQWMYVYQDGRQVYNSAITTGRPELPTPTGTYAVIAKFNPTTFYSPWPEGSPYWYPPSYINYALEWDDRGYFLHDSWWRTTYGPGTNVWHTDPTYGDETGTHGCVTMPLDAAAWLYNWAPIGTTVQIE